MFIFFVVFMGSDKLILEKIYREMVAIRECLEALKRIIIPKEELSSEELEDLEDWGKKL